ncbi:MAG TPA: hypothetical protein VN517_03355 [Terriglobales bacterium]|nr:hypothetical protein [Terriglobales bacterium]
MKPTTTLLLHQAVEVSLCVNPPMIDSTKSLAGLDTEIGPEEETGFAEPWA